MIIDTYEGKLLWKHLDVVLNSSYPDTKPAKFTFDRSYGGAPAGWSILLSQNECYDLLAAFHLWLYAKENSEESFLKEDHYDLFQDTIWDYSGETVVLRA